MTQDGTRRIVISCDGTWQRLDAVWPTNPVLLSQAVAPADPGDGRAQIICHLDGVGTGRGTGALARGIDRLFGGLKGSGLDSVLAEAYRHLVFAYRPGDAIYLFGYSRGAYTARSLAGMINNCGILSRVHAGRIGEALALYRSRAAADAPDGAKARAFRASYAPATLTREDEREWRQQAYPERDWSGAVDLRIAYLGVWDTVGALGVPGASPLARALNRRHEFHDTRLSRRVVAARHAVAIDERRRTFPPTLWTNVDALNDGEGATDAPYLQHWFPGVHAAVGGGGDDPRLSSSALLWIAEGAARQGLAFEPGALARIAAQQDPTGPLSARTRPDRRLLARLLALRPVDRSGPDRAEDVAASTRARVAALPDYRPRPLAQVMPDLLRGADQPMIASAAKSTAPPAAV